MSEPVKLAWQCTFCGLDLEGNPVMCPRCSYTVYRPVIAPPGDEQVHGNPSKDDRFERARDAAYDAPGAGESQMPNIDAAIEVAARVRITPEIIMAAHTASGLPAHTYGRPVRAAIKAAFEAAGFEVEE